MQHSAYIRKKFRIGDAAVRVPVQKGDSLVFFARVEILTRPCPARPGDLK